jgi:hypothetical protein
VVEVFLYLDAYLHLKTKKIKATILKFMLFFKNTERKKRKGKKASITP